MTCTCPVCANPNRPRSPLASLPGWAIAERMVVEQHNEAVLQGLRAKAEWSDTEPTSRRFAEPREPGKVPVDPDAEQLAAQVGELADELARGVA